VDEPRSDAGRVVVFGGAGFLGSHVADALSDAGRQVIVADLQPSRWLRVDQTELVVDILDVDSVASACEGAVAVFNFAGISDIDACRRDPIATVRTNTLGNTILLEAAARAEARRYVFASSIYVHSRSGSFYRVSKHSCELQAEAYSEQRGLDYTILRYGSLYGPRSDLRNGIFRLLDQAVRGGPVVYAGTGREVREYIHVFDAARLSAESLSPEFANKRLTLTGASTTAVSELLSMIAEIFDVEVKYTDPLSDEHYVGTPYSYRPPLSYKLRSDLSIDLGQGLIDLASSIDDGE
jgi:UDP-glucose 4-epimerase